jgi:hypothetical protein
MPNILCIYFCKLEAGYIIKRNVYLIKLTSYWRQILRSLILFPFSRGSNYSIHVLFIVILNHILKW